VRNPEPPKRIDHEQLEGIVARLTETAKSTHEKHQKDLEKKYLAEYSPQPLSAEEQQEIIDRLFYQQQQLVADRRRQLEEKYLATKKEAIADPEYISELVARLSHTNEKLDLLPLKSGKALSKERKEETLRRLFYEDSKHRKELNDSLEKKWLWGSDSSKRSQRDIDGIVSRLASPSPRR
jgi:5'-3' exonuclease